jgi:hypothetical protein
MRISFDFLFFPIFYFISTFFFPYLLCALVCPVLRTNIINDTPDSTHYAILYLSISSLTVPVSVPVPYYVINVTIRLLHCDFNKKKKIKLKLWS